MTDHLPLSALSARQEATKPAPCGSGATLPVQHVPSELLAEFERRVEETLDRWQRRYAQTGVSLLCSREADRLIAERRVGGEMGLL